MSEVRFHERRRPRRAVPASVFSRVTAMSLSPPFHTEPWLIIMMCADRLASAPDDGRLCIARS